MWIRVLKVLLFAVALAALMQTIRLLLVEPDEVAKACLADATAWRCRLRDLVIQGFARNLYGPISVIAALLAWLGGLRSFAVLAMVAGMAGAVLYSFDLAAVGLLLGALLLARDAAASDNDTVPVIKQQTQSQ